ncbi:sensor histidine kinase [Aliikangiella sp. IMCC44359]|uniref:sensor histidine kinase n=1 Tax=Aliikangiella sp. IMCC44359 TaxID=3459125 RepID=UPI00403AFBEF
MPTISHSKLSNPVVDIKLRELEQMQSATLNILEDFDAEKKSLKEFQRASFNILEDLNEEKNHLQKTQSAVMNMLEDFDDEKAHMEESQKATLNILEDFNVEKERLEETQKATLNILEDFNAEKEKVTKAYLELKEAVKAREEAEKLKFHLASIVDSADDAIFSKDLDGTISSWNKGAEKLYGYNASEAIGQHISFLVPKAQRDEIDMLMKQVLKNEKVEHYETERYCSNGAVISVSLTLSPIIDSCGNVIGVSTIARDISERKRVESELLKARDQLEYRVKERTQELENEREALAKSNKDLEEFAYIASHDLKTPLRNIQSLSCWIEEDLAGVITESTQKYMGHLKKRVEQLNSLLDDLLEYSLAGRKKEDSILVDTQKLILDIVSLYQNEQVEIKLDVLNVLPVFKTQKTEFELVLRNLINNAIKHHDKKQVNLTVTCSEKKDSYIFSIADDGPGIPSNYHERIFGMFKKLKPQDEVEGSGMGLALIKRIVESQGGEVNVISEDGYRGTEFRFEVKKI